MARNSLNSRNIFPPDRSGRDTRQQEERLIRQWEEYLAVREESARIQYWAFRHMEAYAQSNAWENLVLARAAAAGAADRLGQIQVPEFTLPDEDCDRLLDAGIEADAVRLQGQVLEAGLSQCLGQMQGLLLQLQNDVYYRSDFEGLGDLIRLDRESLDLDLALYGHQTNYLLLQLKDRSLWDRLPGLYPVIGSACGVWKSDPRELEMASMEAMDRMEALQKGILRYMGASEYSLFLVKEALTTGNLEHLAAGLNRIRQVPGQFPQPAWVKDRGILRYYFRQGEETVLLQPGEDAAPASCFCRGSVPGVTMDRIRQYMSALDRYQIPHHGEWEEDGRKFSLILCSGDSDMLITWTEAETDIFLPAPMGDLIPELIFRAGQHTNI